MTNYNKTPTDRIDTNHTLVAVRRGDDTSADSTAVRYVRQNFPEFGSVLSVRLTGERDSKGNPVFDVEWEEKET